MGLQRLLSLLPLQVLLVLSLLAFAALPHVPSATAAALEPAQRQQHGNNVGSRHGSRREQWLSSWSAMPQLTEPANLPPPPYNGSDSKFVNATIRQTVRLSAGGKRVRVRFSNAFGGGDLVLSSASIAVPSSANATANQGVVGVPTIEEGSSIPLTFSDEANATIPNGALVVSDAVDLPVNRGGSVTVSLFLAAGQAGSEITSHPGSRTTSYLAPGNQTAATNLTEATAVEHWYFLSGVEVVPSIAEDLSAGATVFVGDSLTDGRGSTTNKNDRWPDLLFPRVRHGAFLNQAAGGNRILADGLGPNVLSRLDRDVFAQTGVSRVFLFEGVNDIGTAPATAEGQEEVVRRLVSAYKQVATRVHAQRMPLYVATITPFGNNTAYAHLMRERSRVAINEWIRSSKEGLFDAVVDFDAAVRDAANATVLAARFDSGDGLHLNPAGYQAMAEAVNVKLFRSRFE